MQIDSASRPGTVESRLLVEMNRAAAEYAQAEGKERRSLLKEYLVTLNHFTDRILEDLARADTVHPKSWSYRCHAAQRDRLF
ncbi:MAG TPA: hypothetical protein VGF16_19230 [Bryobacteraceae bacterium]